MAVRASVLTGPASEPKRVSATKGAIARLAFVVLLGACPLLPQLGSSIRDYPAVSNAWVMLPFGGLFLLGLVDLDRPWRMAHADLLALLTFAVALACWSQGRVWPLAFVYAPLVYLVARMAIVARVGRPERALSRPVTPSAPAPALAPMPTLPRSWLIAGIVVLSAVHVSWTFGARVNTDTGAGSAQVARQLLRGQPVYGANRALVANLGYDPHFDTYGPADYEAYAPFASVAGNETAARLATICCDLLTALLLFALGRQTRGPTAGIVLAYAWLAFPLTLYADGLAPNDQLVAAALVGTLLAARSPLRRGALAAVAAWTKLTPLALVPLLAGYQPHGGRARRAQLATFAAAFALVSVLVLIPALDHGSMSTFVARTFGFQLSRGPGYSIWERLGDPAVIGADTWIRTVADATHGLITAVAGAGAVMLLWARKHQDVVGLAGASAAVLSAVLICDGYFSFTYVLWLVPLVLVALVLDRGGEHRLGSASAQATTVSSVESPVSTS
jgi:hypothetical protein